MKNKLGVNESLFEDMEKKLVNIKLNLLDERFTFNSKELDFEYMNKLNIFLFSDIYDLEELGLKEETKELKTLINYYLSEILYLCTYYKEEVNQILKILQTVWEIQPFNVGNTRTLLGYLKVLNIGFELGLDINVNKPISSGLQLFELDNPVNQKRLTK